MNAWHPMAHLRVHAASNPGRPCLVWRDGPTRIELSAASAWNYAVKAANLLTEEFELPEQGRVRLDLPPHWQSAGLALGVWLAGGRLADSAQGCEVVFGVAGEPADAVTSLDPWGGPCKESVPAGVLDLGRELRGQPDVLLDPRPLDGLVAALMAGDECRFDDLSDTAETWAGSTIGLSADPVAPFIGATFIRAVAAAAGGATLVMCPVGEKQAVAGHEHVDLWV
ncbi:MAG: hypothetical protein KGP01_01790 [Actinomycetales bacterium]|nr:hypothetical protein [Actinomycetales bacterium]